MTHRSCCCGSDQIPCDAPDICMTATFSGILPSQHPSPVPVGKGGTINAGEIIIFAGVNGSVRLPRAGDPPVSKPCLIVVEVQDGPNAGATRVYTSLAITHGWFCWDQDGQTDAIATGILDMGDVFSSNIQDPVFLGQPIPNANDDTPDPNLNPPFDEFGTLGREGNGVITAEQHTTCPPLDEYTVAVPCSGVGDPISVDLSTNIGGKPGFTYNGVLYTALDEVTTDPPVSVLWVDQYCTNSDKQRTVYAYPCDGIGAPVTIDPNTRPSDGVTIEVASKRYSPTDEISPDTPVSGTWFTTPCPTPPRYLANPCVGSGGAPIAYELKPGMLPGEGVCIIRYEQIGPNGQPCYTYGKTKCTTNLTTDTTIPLGEQFPGDCSQPTSWKTGDCDNIEPPSNPCDLPVGHPQRPPGCPGIAITRSLPLQSIPDDYDADTSAGSPKVDGGCGCTPPEGVD